MAQRGRKSVAERAMVALPSVQRLASRPPPPEGLDESERARWIAICDERPADYWLESDLPLLYDLVRTERMVRDCDRLIAEHGTVYADARGELKRNPAVGTRDAHLRLITTLQRTLRLSPSARYKTDRGQAKQQIVQTKRPWEM